MNGKLEGKKAAIFYQDSNDHVSRKDGVITTYSDSEVILNYNIIILKSRIVRIEVQP